NVALAIAAAIWVIYASRKFVPCSFIHGIGHAVPKCVASIFHRFRRRGDGTCLRVLVQIPTEIPCAMGDSRQRYCSRMDCLTGFGGQEVRGVGDPKYLCAGL